jgi:hypothetical protein
VTLRTGPKPRVGQLETFRQFDHRHLRYVTGGFIAEDFRQKKNVLKYSSSHGFLSRVSHNIPLQKKRRSSGSPRSAFALGRHHRLHLTGYLRNPYAINLEEKPVELTNHPSGKSFTA